MSYLDIIILFILMIVTNLITNRMTTIYKIKIITKERLSLIDYLLHRWQTIDHDGFYKILLEQKSQLEHNNLGEITWK